MASWRKILNGPEKTGYGHPPKNTRFKLGQSGNPRGRPRNRHGAVPYDAVLGQMVTIRENGRDRRVTAAEAFLLQLAQKGLAGDAAAAGSSLDAIEGARAKHPDVQEVTTIVICAIRHGISTVVGKLGIGVKKYGRDEHRVRWELHPRPHAHRKGGCVKRSHGD